MKHIELGASLYLPATRHDVLQIANGEKLPFLRSMIFCLEDAIHCDDVEPALENMRRALPLLRPAQALRFIRPRNPQILSRLLEMRGISNIDGFVLPKVTPQNILHYTEQIGKHDRFLLMPTLETVQVFDHGAMRELREALMAPDLRPRVLSLRIGGNDLLQHLGARRSRKRTIYESPLAGTIASLAGCFTPYGFNLTAPVFEGMADEELLAEEVERDLEFGLFGKTAIHPAQITTIEREYEVSYQDYEMALALVRDDSPAVFRMHDSLCEVATHLRWAEVILARAKVYGVRPAPEAVGEKDPMPTFTSEAG